MAIGFRVWLPAESAQTEYVGIVVEVLVKKGRLGIRVLTRRG